MGTICLKKFWMDRMYYTEGEDIKYEVFPLSKGKKILLYLSYFEGVYFINNKCFGKYYLEQIFDENNQIIKETIKENSNFKEWKDPCPDSDYD